MIVISNASNVPLYLQIYDQIKDSILSGEISEGSKLTSIRMLCAKLNVSKNTVESAYQQLCSEGYIASRAGSGFICQRLDNIEVLRPAGHSLKKVEEPAGTAQEMDSKEDYKYRFSYGNLSASDFPLLLWKKLTNKCLSSISAESLASSGDRKGEPGLRTELMHYLTKSRGVSCNPDQIIVCAGTEYCLSLLCQLLRGSFDQIAVEDPGYRGAKSIFINSGYEVVPVGLDKDGIHLEELESSSAKVVYITPSHQFPTGCVMSIQKRLKLLDWAKRKRGIIIEDDYDSEFRYNSRPIPSLQGLDSKESVVYIGTFSKALSPSLRMSYMVLPQPLIEKYDKLFDRYQASTPLIEQKIVQQFMYEGHWDRHLRKISHDKKRKHDLLIRTIHEVMGDKVIIHGKDAGLHILLEFNNGLSEMELVKRAKNHGVFVLPVSGAWMREEKYSDNMIMLSFSKVSENEIVGGIKALNAALLGR